MFAAANGPKHLITFDSPSGAGFGAMSTRSTSSRCTPAALPDLLPLMPPPARTYDEVAQKIIDDFAVLLLRSRHRAGGKPHRQPPE